MEEYLGKICPYCKTVIKEDENIILCSDCGMPHHQECWTENQGCTTFGCLGTIQGVNQSAESMGEIPAQPHEEQLSCFKCGYINPFSNTFCRRCGARLLKPLGTNGAPPGQPIVNMQEMQPVSGSVQATGIPVNTQPSGYTAGQQPHGTPPHPGFSTPQNETNTQGYRQNYGNYPFTAGSAVSETDFIKDNIQYYRQKFMEMRMENKKNSWNWSAWFFNVSWCFYRKMYKVGFIFLGIQVLVSLLSVIRPILTLLTSISLGIFGNHLYMRYTEKALKKAESVPELQRHAYLRKKGGTSIGAVLLLYGGALCIGFVIGIFIEFMSYMG